MKKKSLVIGDIASHLNISVTTVSFILNGKAQEKRISEKLTQKVINYAREVNYTPNLLAQSLRTGKTNLIGLIVENISNPFFANIARLIEENAYKNGFRIIYCSSENDTKKAKELMKVFRERKIDAYIIIPTENTENEVNNLLNENARVVLLDRYFPGLSTNYVGVNNSESTYNAICHLIEQGFQRIGFVTLSSAQTQMNERLDGYNRAIDENNLKSYIKKILFDDNNNDHYIKHITKFFQKEKTIDAVFFATNYLGISGLEAIRNLKKKIPSNIGVISFDDHDAFRLYSPAITAIAQPIEEMSEQLINILLEDLDSNNSNKKTKTIILPAKLIIRESSIKK
ncbi:MAG: substrate-binding domain-containing protein [Bacteroidota bacterium]|nr:substrate-binding domain-containing protein [Bacteroidota bacterium]